jgi:hypothetical protein
LVPDSEGIDARGGFVDQTSPSGESCRTPGYWCKSAAATMTIEQTAGTDEISLTFFKTSAVSSMGIAGVW